MKKNENHPSQGKTPKQYSKQLIISALSAILSFGVLAVATAAWFANNRDVNASGMKIQVDPVECLVIQSDAGTIVSDPRTTVTFDNKAAYLSPATHGGSYGTGLQYNSNPSAISIETGYVISNGSLGLADVPIPDDKPSPYYRDYVVYIASLNKAFEKQDLVATMTLMNPDGGAELGDNNEKDYMQAASIDFYVGDTIDGSTYKGTLNAAGISAPNTPKTNVKLVENDKIPLSTDPPLKVTMRCYFDGALQKTAADGSSPATAYVRNAGLSIGDFSILVKFSATDHAPSTT